MIFAGDVHSKDVSTTGQTHCTWLVAAREVIEQKTVAVLQPFNCKDIEVGLELLIIAWMQTNNHRFNTYTHI